MRFDEHKKKIQEKALPDLYTTDDTLNFTKIYADIEPRLLEQFPVVRNIKAEFTTQYPHWFPELKKATSKRTQINYLRLKSLIAKLDDEIKSLDVLTSTHELHRDDIVKFDHIINQKEENLNDDIENDSINDFENAQLQLLLICEDHQILYQTNQDIKKLKYKIDKELKSYHSRLARLKTHQEYLLSIEQSLTEPFNKFKTRQKIVDTFHVHLDALAQSENNDELMRFERFDVRQQDGLKRVHQLLTNIFCIE